MAVSLEAWAEAGLCDFVIFDSKGIVTSAYSRLLSAIAVGDDIFAKLPVLHGYEDFLDVQQQSSLPLIFDGVRLPGLESDQILDFRLGRHSDRSSGLLLVLANSSYTGITAENMRDSRKANFLEGLLQKERSRFKEIYHNSPIASFAVESNGSLIAVSEKFQDWIGYQTDPADWIGKFCKVHQETWIKATDAETGRASFEATVSVCHDQTAIVEVFVQVIPGVDESPETFVAIHDVTNRKKLVAELERHRRDLAETAEMLTHSNRRLEQFAHIAAHDLLGPLGRMSSFSEIIELELGISASTMVTTAVNAIKISALEGIELVTDLLTLAKLEHFKPEWEEIDVERMIRHVASLLSLSAPLDLQFTGVRLIRADARLLRLIARNVLSNSFKYRKHDVPLLVTVSLLESSTGYVQLILSDNGTGFDSAEADAFAAFSRMREHASVEGTGLGLAMVKDAADILGWRAGIFSKRNVGTTLKFEGIIKSLEII